MSHKPGSGWDEIKIGEISIYMNDEGKLSVDGTVFNNKELTISMNQVEFENGESDRNWKFYSDGDDDALTKGNKYGIDADVEKEYSSKLMLEYEGRYPSTVPESFSFKVAVVNNGHQSKGYVEIKVNKGDGKTDISKDNVSISLTFDGDKNTKVYDGQSAKVTAITITKDGKPEKLTSGFTAEFYKGNTKVDNPKDVYLEGNTASAYDVVITIDDNTKGYKGTRKVEDAYTITQRDLHINPVADKTITCTIGEGGTFAGSEYFTIAMADGTGDDLITGDNAKIEGNITISKEQATGESVSITLPDGLSVVADNSSNYNADNYKLIWNNGNTYTVKVTAKDFSEDDEGGNISVSFGENGNNTKEYDGDPIPNVIVKDDETTLTQGKDYTVSYKDEKGTTLENVPSDAGKYTVVITGDGNYAKESIEKPYEITKRELTIKINDQTITLPSTEINSEITTGEGGTVTITGTVKNQTVALEGSIKAADTDYTTAGTYQDCLIADDDFKLKEGVDVNKNYEMPVKVEAGDLIVKAAPVDWTDGKNTHADITVYVNEEGVITGATKGTVSDGTLSISLSDNFDLSEWKFTIVNYLAVMSGDQDIQEGGGYYTWSTIYAPNGGDANGLRVSKNDDSEVISGLPKEVKAKIEKADGSVGYLSFTFETEKAEEPDDDNSWTEGTAQATVTVYVSEDGNIVVADHGEVKENKLTVSMADVNLSNWQICKKDYLVVLSGDQKITEGLLWETVINAPTENPSYNVEAICISKKESTSVYDALPQTVKVKIENDDNVGYIAVAFEKIVVIDPSDITGGDDDDENGEIDENGNLLGTAEGEKTVYDSETHELAILKVNGLDEPLRVGEDYTVVYTAKESGDLVDNLPYHAGIYDVTITLGDKYITTTGAKEFATTVEITKRDLHLAFSIEENAKIEDLNEKLDLTEGLVICTPENLAQNDNLAGVITATFTIGQEPVDGLYPVYPETIHFENTENFNYTDYNISYDYTDLTGIEHQEEITPDEDGDVEIGDGEGEIPADDPIGGIEYVNPETGEGSAGGYYEKKYRLYLAVKDKNSYYVEDAEADYAAEGLELFSLHDKKTTWAGGSFTVWYEHNKVANEGGYRVFIKRGKHADYEEVKLDEVSGYYQIRNVQSDIYVRLYFGTGFPVANEEITATDVRAYAQANKIVVITPEPTDVQIISMAGAVVATDQVTGQREFANLAEGVYIVRMGETVIKLQVRN